MSLTGVINALYNSRIGSDNVRMTEVYPAAGTIGAAVTNGKQAYGAWAQLVAAASLTDPAWLAWVWPQLLDVDTEFSQDVQVGVGAACSESARANIGMNQKVVTGVGVYGLTSISLPVPIRIAGTPRVAARGATNNCAATNALGVKAGFITALGT